jgi:hypothetical protein
MMKRDAVETLRKYYPRVAAVLERDAMDPEPVAGHVLEVAFKCGARPLDFTIDKTVRADFEALSKGGQ